MRRSGKPKSGMKIAALSETSTERRTQLTRERVVAAAIELADRDGIEAVSMRRLAQELGVEAMSLYTHVRNKDDLLDGMVDAVIDEIPITADGADWKTSLRTTVLAARGIILRHTWAPRTVETRTAPGPAVPRYANAVIGILREGGFSVALAHHALHILGSRVLGFSQDLFDESPDLDPEAAAQLVAQLGATLPYAAEMAVAVTHDGVLGACDDDVEFEFALDFILDGLDRLRNR
ncbi:TetR/AcrR family transcriptional regulator C-terminal domain-containing protein [Nonomuraea guangzhouensis]|uniref:TetR/AcrR family transcriptional regulator C-terminal domain-containing protein n=1 Tax=Nonomuraea guangzhouensis TaxID=1291555 RepID=A0ABW4GY54_9ACTN|nr:TetR/AcrR family transcriptional regulator C-terminal domain-containing protein [Nonomuraea guangzhouensis]